MPEKLRSWVWKLIHQFLKLTTFTAVFVLVIGRDHYSIDVVLAYYVTTRTFWIYHELCAAVRLFQ